MNYKNSIIPYQSANTASIVKAEPVTPKAFEASAVIVPVPCKAMNTTSVVPDSNAEPSAVPTPATVKASLSTPEYVFCLNCQLSYTHSLLAVHQVV